MAYLKNYKHLTKKNTSDFILEIKLLIKIHGVLTLICHTLYFLWMSSLFICFLFFIFFLCAISYASLKLWFLEKHMSRVYTIKCYSSPIESS